MSTMSNASYSKVVMSKDYESTINSELLVIQQAARLIAHSAEPEPTIQAILRSASSNCV